MEMRKVKRTVEVEDYVFVAEDGKVFKTREECENYEYDLKYSAAKKRLQGITHFSADPPDGDIDCLYRWYYLRSQQDLDDLRFKEYYDKDATAYEFGAQEFPCWVRLAVYGNGCGDIVSLEQHRKEVIGYLEALDNKVATLSGIPDEQMRKEGCDRTEEQGE